MGMRISTNMASITAQRTMVGSQREVNKSMAQLASGSRITKAADDAAGLAISESLKSQIRSYTQAGRNANDGISLVQTAEGGLSEVTNILTRVRELGIQASSDTVGDRERGYLNKEVNQLISEVDRISKSTKFGTTNLIDGSGDSFEFQVGINSDKTNDRIAFNASETNVTADNLGVSGFDFSSKDGAQGALSTVDEALSKVSGMRANLGALQNRLQVASDNIGVMHENISAANSRIRDTDIAQSSSEMTKNNILMQANSSVLAQANMMPQSALKLLG